MHAIGHLKKFTGLRKYLPYKDNIIKSKLVEWRITKRDIADIV
jgi:hypothetical protein